MLRHRDAVNEVHEVRGGYEVACGWFEAVCRISFSLCHQSRFSGLK